MSKEPPRKRRKTQRADNNFQHAALIDATTCIRLVRFLRTASDKTLRLELQSNLELDEGCPEFIAFSYEWGPPDPTHTVLINGKSFAVRKNLHEFLDTLYNQHKGKSLGFFWADAICIDQTNVQERNHQVQQMKHIYRQASKVLAWVGLSLGAHDDKLVRSLKTCYHNELQSVVDNKYKSWASLWCDIELHGSLTTLLARSYWGRLWIVQELIMAGKVQVIWGDLDVDLDAIVSCLIGRVYVPERVIEIADDQPSEMIAWYMFGWKNAWTEHTLTTAISYFGDFECSLPHDKVYGLLGMSNDHSDICVDYNTSIEQLFMDVVCTSTSHVQLGELFVVAEILKLSLDIQEHELHVSLKGDCAKAKSDSLIKYLLPAIGRTGELSLSTFHEKLQEEQRGAFAWVWFDFRPVNAGLINRFASSMAASQARCRCVLCCRYWTYLDMPSDPVRFFEKYECLYPGTVKNIETRRIPHFCLLFCKKQYVATVVFYESQILGPKNPCTLYRDPFYDSWSVKDETRLTEGEERRKRKRIEMTRTSVLLAIAHGLGKKEELERSGSLPSRG